MCKLTNERCLLVCDLIDYHTPEFKIQDLTLFGELFFSDRGLFRIWRKVIRYQGCVIFSMTYRS